MKARRSVRTGLARARSSAIGLVALVCVGCGSKTGLFVPDGERADAAFEARAADADARGSFDASDAPPTLEDAAIAFDANDETAQGIVVALDGLRWELPCESTINDAVCTTPAERRVATTLVGPPGARYVATFRFRGVVETKAYDGGTNDGAFWQIGGVPHGDTVNVYGLTISSPPQQYYLNRVSVDAFACFAIDYEETVTLDTGATVTLDAASEDDRELRNLDVAGRPIVVQGVRPAPEPFDGQFIQLDVLSLQRVR